MAANDLTGRQFGGLTVLRLDGQRAYPSGRQERLWRCRCRCGNEVTVPHGRLPHVPSVKPTHIIDACPACRSHSCAVCGKAILPPATTVVCSAVCRATYTAQQSRERYRREIDRNPQLNTQRAARDKLRAQSDLAFAIARRNAQKRKSSLRWKLIKEDTCSHKMYLDHKRDYYLRNKNVIKFRLRTRIRLMDNTKREQLRASDRMKKTRQAHEGAMAEIMKLGAEIMKRADRDETS